MLPALLATVLLATALAQTTTTPTPSAACDCSGCCQLLPLWIVMGALGGVGLGVLGTWLYFRYRAPPRPDPAHEPLMPGSAGTVVFPGRIVVPMSRGMRSG